MKTPLPDSRRHWRAHIEPLLFVTLLLVLTFSIAQTMPQAGPAQRQPAALPDHALQPALQPATLTA